jgi:ribosomal protein S21
MRQTDRRRKTAAARYGSLQSFYMADERRVHSRECDVGLWWRESADGPLHRAAWICDTGELYLARLGPPEQGGGRVEVLAIVAEHEQLEQALVGWRKRCGEPQSLAWLRERARRLGGRVRARRAQVTAAVASAGAVLTTGLSLAVELA